MARNPRVRAGQPQEPPRPPERLVWLENEFAIYAIAQSSTRWLAGCPYARFWHAEGEAYVTAWPVRLSWTLWWMKEPRPNPSTPADLAFALSRQPPRNPATRACGSLIDPEARKLDKHGEPWIDDPGPILPAGTRVVAGEPMPDGCDGFDSQFATIASGPWAGTLVDLRIGRAGEPYLIARLGIVPEDEPIASDRGAAHSLLERLRDIKRQNPS